MIKFVTWDEMYATTMLKSDMAKAGFRNGWLDHALGRNSTVALTDPDAIYRTAYVQGGSLHRSGRIVNGEKWLAADLD